MLLGIIFHPYFGMPLIAWGGIFTFICLWTTATIGYIINKNIRHWPVKWHQYLAIITLISASIHGIVAFLAFLGV
jgi:hypothetical protein